MNVDAPVSEKGKADRGWVFSRPGMVIALTVATATVAYVGLFDRQRWKIGGVVVLGSLAYVGYDYMQIKRERARDERQRMEAISKTIQGGGFFGSLAKAIERNNKIRDEAGK